MNNGNVVNERISLCWEAAFTCRSGLKNLGGLGSALWHLESSSTSSGEVILGKERDLYSMSGRLPCARQSALWSPK